MPDAVIAIGSNVGDRYSYLKQAVDKIQSLGNVEQVAPLYETSAYGFTDQPDFLNSALLLRTMVTPRTLLHELKAIEDQLGRKQRIRWGPREIDLDIIFYDDLQMQSHELSIPHPDFHNRRFVLEPLSEIAPEWKSPTDGRTVVQLLNNCPDKTIIEVVNKEWYPDGVKV
jgi:2-amino-4-hydroxy-6-hydroxymethyldihydropteridine diphosphokinase